MPDVDEKQVVYTVVLSTIGDVVDRLNDLAGILKAGVRFDESQYQYLAETALKILEKVGLKRDIKDLFTESRLRQTISTLENINQKTIIGDFLAEGGEMESRALNKMELDELVAAREKASADQRQKIDRVITEKTGVKDVETMVARQKEIAAQKANELGVEPERMATKLAVEEEKSKEIADRVVETAIEKEKTKEIAEAVTELALKKANGEISDKEVRAEIKRIVGKNEEKLIEKVIDRVELVSAKVETDMAAEEIAIVATESLEKEGKVLPHKFGPEVREQVRKIFEGEEREIKIPGIEDNPTLKRATLTAQEYLEKKPDQIRMVRSEKLSDEIGQEMRGSGAKEEEIRELQSLVEEFYFHEKSIDLEPHRQRAEVFLGERRTVDSPGKIQGAWEDVGGVTQAVRMAPKKFNNFVDRYNLFAEKFGRDKLPKIKKVQVIERLTSAVSKNPEMLKLMNLTQRVVGFTDKLNGATGSILVRLGAKEMGLKIIGKVGGQAAARFAENALAIMAEQGGSKGAMMILRGILGGGVKAGTAGASAAGGGGLAGLLASSSAFLASNPVGWVITVVILALMALKFVWDTFIAPIIKLGKSIIAKLGLNPDWVKDGFIKLFGNNFLGKTAGKLGQFGHDVFVYLILIPQFLKKVFQLSSIMVVLIPVIIVFAVIMGLITMTNTNLISSLVPPPPMGGGNCVLKSEEGGGQINCDQNAPANDVAVDKSNFASLAGRWKSEGKNYAEECFNDTVNRALCAGKNPTYALWAWMHESGASNYGIPKVEDFGVHYINKPMDFNAQITEFLKLDMGHGKCFTDPNSKTRGDYWLSFATSYLTGTDKCDPDFMVGEMSGRLYLQEMQDTWGWLGAGPMPANIDWSTGGQNCGNWGSGSEEEPTNEYVDDQGRTWVCYAGSNAGIMPNFPPWDPNTPVPEGCPSREPVAGYITQGPFAAGCSHAGMSIPAIDYGAGNGTEILAAHKGVVSYGSDQIYGNYIDLHGTCEGKEFYTRYAHMPEGGFRAANGATVEPGTIIGVVNNTGSSTGPHLHYHISGLEAEKFGQYLGMSVEETEQLWGCCGSWNGKYCP